MLQGQYGISDLAISVPTVVDRNGINRILEVPLAENEQKLLKNSADTLKSVIKELRI
ncbi:MAG: hypothetical protein GX796_09025 [Clostridiaceae bacterium]|nr:hypothetical protein [Clostridiaceae bacterium]